MHSTMVNYLLLIIYWISDFVALLSGEPRMDKMVDGLFYHTMGCSIHVPDVPPI